MREFSLMDIPFGLFMAVVLILVSVTVAGLIVIVILGYGYSEGMETVLVISGFAPAAGMLVLARLYPGPGLIVEKPLLAIAAFISLPLLAGILAAMDMFPFDAPWYFPVMFYGVFPSSMIGFAVFFAIVSEARKSSQTGTMWPIPRPASSQGGLYALPRDKAKVYAGLERGGPEEQRPDTFTRMKTG